MKREDGSLVNPEELRKAIKEVMTQLVKHGIVIELPGERFQLADGIEPDGPEWTALLKELEEEGWPHDDIQSFLQQIWLLWPAEFPKTRTQEEEALQLAKRISGRPGGKE